MQSDINDSTNELENTAINTDPCYVVKCSEDLNHTANYGFGLNIKATVIKPIDLNTNAIFAYISIIALLAFSFAVYIFPVSQVLIVIRTYLL